MCLGHFHEVTLSFPKGKPPVAECGPPLYRYYDKTSETKRIREMAHDSHTHDVTYFKSERIKVPLD